MKMSILSILKMIVVYFENIFFLGGEEVGLRLFHIRLYKSDLCISMQKNLDNIFHNINHQIKVLTFKGTVLNLAVVV